MIVVIQCAARKTPAAGYLLSTDGTPVKFVADPAVAPPVPRCHHARPDDASGYGGTWREILLDYNRTESGNPLGLLPAWRLYAHPIYERLASRLGSDRLYILSAGWGLIAAPFLTPAYDITFSPGAENYKRRGRRDRYQDFCMLPGTTAEPLVFFGGKDYLALFRALTHSHAGRRTVYYNSARIPDAPGCELRRYRTTTRTNWHYACAAAFLERRLD